MVWDAPWSITSLGTRLEKPARDGLWRRMLLGRCLDYGLRHLLRGFGVMDEGGILCLPRLNQDQSEDSEVGSEAEEEGFREDGDNGAGPSGRTVSDRGGNAQEGPEAKCPASGESQGSGVIPGEFLESGAINCKFVKSAEIDSVNLEELRLSGKKRVAEDPGHTDQRFTPDEGDLEGKATKLDDAEVKVRKWNSRLAVILGKPLTHKMETSMDVLRGFFLRRHKR